VTTISWICAIRSTAAFHSTLHSSLIPRPFSSSAIIATTTTTTHTTQFVHSATSPNKDDIPTSTSTASLTADNTYQSQQLILINKAKTFLQHKNAAGRGETTLDPLFSMLCCPSSNNSSKNNKNNNNNNNTELDLYGLRGDDVRPGLTSFFQNYPELHHELIAEPTVIGPMTVQYPFVKSWRRAEDGEVERWSSIDGDKGRNKVERLEFDSDGFLVKVSVVAVTD
jgi:hypothetical protein